MVRGPRINVTVTEREEAWLRWYAGQVGRSPSTAASRLLERAIQEEQARPDLARAFAEDVGTFVPPAEVINDIAVAFGVAGVAEVLSGTTAGATREALRAAGYLQRLERWLARKSQGALVGDAPSLRDEEANPWHSGPLDRVTQLLVGTARGPLAEMPPGGAYPGSDKRRLSDVAHADGEGGRGDARA